MTASPVIEVEARRTSESLESAWSAWPVAGHSWPQLRQRQNGPHRWLSTWVTGPRQPNGQERSVRRDVRRPAVAERPPVITLLLPHANGLPDAIDGYDMDADLQHAYVALEAAIDIWELMDEVLPTGPAASG